MESCENNFCWRIGITINRRDTFAESVPEDIHYKPGEVVIFITTSPSILL